MNTCKSLAAAAVIVACTACMPSCTSSHAGETPNQAARGKRLDISFDFTRGGIASSQFAVWIETENGDMVRTLYATSFTAKGGYAYRKDALPAWVAKAHPDRMTASQADAVTGATPQNGPLLYSWDGTDDADKPVKAGRYRFCIEATNYWQSRTLWTGTVTWGGKEETDIPLEEHRYHPSDTNQYMITNLRANYLAR